MIYKGTEILKGHKASYIAKMYNVPTISIKQLKLGKAVFIDDEKVDALLQNGLIIVSPEKQKELVVPQSKAPGSKNLDDNKEIKTPKKRGVS